MRTPRLLHVTAALVLALGLAACSGEDDKDDADGTGGESTVAVDPSRVSPSDLPEVPEVKKGQGAISDTTFGECATDAGRQRVTGTVENSTTSKADYVVTVSWINETSDVLARGVAVVEDLGAGASSEIEVSAEVPEGVSNCTFHVVRGALD